ncbi:MAG: DUF3857 domain-containing protein [Sphingobacteriales bacterium]|jgi:hypothetical protein|nr:MAG: DUF3857 domain-containing protein [Sphingobacteriales bacterium]
MKTCITAMCSLLLYFFAPAQDKAPVKFGKVEPADFEIKQVYDTGAAAVVIADVGESYFEGNSKGWFTLIFKHKKRVKIINRNGFDVGDVQVSLYSQGTDEERLQDLKAITYNLENGKVVETKLDNSAVFKEKINKNVIIKKFTFPAIKEGSIVELSYTIASDFLFNLQPWEFQGTYPRLWSEYNVKMPEFFNYVFLSQGYRPFHIKKQESGFQSFTIIESGGTAGGSSDRYDIRANTSDFKWVIKDVPALKEESFTSTLRNHIQRISFQLSEYRKPLVERQVMGNWFTVSENMLKRQDFGALLDKNNNWLDDELKRICGSETNLVEKAKKIYAYVRDNFTCTDYSALYMEGEGNLKQVFSKKNGNVAEINLLLAAMLRHENINADPIILSTREHGITNELYPLMEKFNYVVIISTINNSDYVMDASRPELGFNKLAANCYNGHGRIIAKDPTPVYFIADSLKEKKVTSVIMLPDEKSPSKILGGFTSSLGYYESLSVRSQLRENGQEAFFKKIKEAYTLDVTLDKPVVDSMTKKEDPIQLAYDFSFEMPDEDIIYINPMMGEGIKENYFKAAERFYPVEMPFAMDETYILDFEVPKGYSIDEIPKSAKVAYNDGEGFFEYMTSKDEGHVRLRMRIKLNKATFEAEEYDSLREFFGYIVKKHAELIVLKKAK